MALVGNKKRGKVMYIGDPADLEKVEEQSFHSYILSMASKHDIEDEDDASGLFGLAQKGQPFPETVREGMEARQAEDDSFDAETAYQSYEAFFEEVKADIENSDAIAKAKDDQKQADQAAKKAEREAKKAEREKAKQDAEKALAAATKTMNKSHSAALAVVSKAGKGFLSADPVSMLPEGFKLDLETGKTLIPKDASREQLIDALTRTAAIRDKMKGYTDSLYWLVGDTILRYRKNYDSSWEKAIEATGVGETLGLSLGTLRRNALICERFPNKYRIKGLTFTHFQEAYCALPEDREKAKELTAQINEVLKTAAKGRKVGQVTRPLPAQAFVRKEVKALKDAAFGKKPVPERVEAMIIGVSVDEETGISSPTIQYSGVPLEPNQVLTLVREGYIIVPRKKKLQFVDADGPHNVAWIEAKTIDTSTVDKELKEEEEAKAAAKAEKEAKKAKKGKGKKKEEEEADATPEPPPAEEEPPAEDPENDGWDDDDDDSPADDAPADADDDDEDWPDDD